ncbi:MAG: hypothetical protein MZV63_00060 [Marinilabiliales bacterium]|nr:hypothetical protein [Marinilabiliales bacterium]
MIYSGEFLKIFPVDDLSSAWRDPKEAYKFVSRSEDSLYLRNIVNLYANEILNGNTTGNYTKADEMLTSIINYQRNNAKYELPSNNKVKAEVLYFKSKIYDKLFPFYATIGFLLLFVLLYGIISQKKNLNYVIKISTWLLVLGFIFHTVGLGIRWYVSGHAPMSNGYESMIFISWVTILAGFILENNQLLCWQQHLF